MAQPLFFLHHQPKQYGGENNKTHKGATAFEDAVDESYFLAQAKSDKQDEILFYLEPQKHRHATQIQGLRVNLKDLKITQASEIERLWMGKSDREIITLKVFAGIISKNKDGISQSELIKLALKFAGMNHFELVGRNAIWRLLNEYEGRLFRSQKGGYLNKKIYKPIDNLDYQKICDGIHLGLA